MTMRWVHRPEGSNWGEFGDDDQLGRLNLITPKKVRQGLAEAREGISFSLSLPLDLPGGTALNPRRHPPALRPTIREGRPNFNVTLDDPLNTDVFNDDLAILYLQYSTQWDSLAHVGGLFDADGDGVAERVYYNGFRAGEDLIGPTDLTDAGVGLGSTSSALRPKASACVCARQLASSTSCWSSRPLSGATNAIMSHGTGVVPWCSSW